MVWFGDRVLATDSTEEGKRARLITVGLRDGVVRELYSEAVSEEDRNDFSPW